MVLKFYYRKWGSAVFRKQPAEKYPVAVDFAYALDTGETINATTSTVKAYDANGNDVTTTIIDGSITVNGSEIRATVKGGDDGNTYKLTYTCVTNNGNQFEQDVKMICREL